IVIGIVAIVAFVGFYLYYNRSTSTTTRNTNGNTATNVARANPIPSNAPQGANPPNYLGSPNAAVTVEEFADFQCPSCGATHPVMKQIQSMFGPPIKFIYPQFPFAM